MKRVEKARARVGDLKKRIKVAKERKDHFQNYQRKLHESHKKGKISSDFYLETSYKHHNGKTIQEWINYYEEEINHCKRLIRKKRIKRHISIIFLSSVFILLLYLSTLYIQPRLSGFAIDDSIIKEDTNKSEAVWVEYSKFEKGITYQNANNPNEFKLETRQVQQYKNYDGEWKRYEEIERTKNSTIEKGIDHVSFKAIAKEDSPSLELLDENDLSTLSKKIDIEELVGGVWITREFAFVNTTKNVIDEDNVLLTWLYVSKDAFQDKVEIIFNGTESRGKWEYVVTLGNSRKGAVTIRPRITLSPGQEVDEFISKPLGSKSSARGGPINPEKYDVAFSWKFETGEDWITFNALDMLENGLLNASMTEIKDSIVTLYANQISLLPGESIIIDPELVDTEDWGSDVDSSPNVYNSAGAGDGEDWVGNQDNIYRVVADFDIDDGTFDATHTVTNVALTVNVASVFDGGEIARVGPYGTDGQTTALSQISSDATVYANADVLGNGVTWVDDFDLTSTGLNTYADLGSSAITDVEAARDAGTTMSIALQTATEISSPDRYSDLDEFDEGSPPVLTITYSVEVDESPTVTLTSPEDSAAYSSAQTVNFQATASDDFIIQNVTFYWDVSGSWEANGTNTSGINGTTYTFPRDFKVGDYTWNVLACDNSSQCAFASANRSFSLHTNQIELINPKTESPVSVSDEDNITIRFNYSVDGTNQTSGVSIEDVFIGGSQATIIGGEGSQAGTGELYSDNFEDGGDWLETGDCAAFINYGSSTPSGNTGPQSGDSDDSGSNFVYIETSNNNCDGTPSSWQLVFDQEIDWDAQEGENVTFETNRHGDSDLGTMIVQENSSGSWQQLGSYTQTGNDGNSGNSWTGFEIDASGLSGTGYVRFSSTGHASFTGDAAVDNFNITYEIPAVPGQQFGFVNGAWEVNVTVPTLGSVGLQDLFVNATYSGITANETETNAVQYPGGGDATNPTITLYSPEDTTNSSSGTNTFSALISDDTAVDTVILYGNFSGSWETNETSSSGINNSFYNFTIGLPDGYYIWTYWANDTSGNSVFASSNRTLTIDTTAPLVGLNSPENNTNFNTDLNLNFTGAVRDTTGIQNVSFYLDGVLNQTNSTVFTELPSIGTYTSTSFDLLGSSGSDDPFGITYYEGFFWITDILDSLVYKYWTNGTYTDEFINTSANGAPAANLRGITVYDDFFWMVDIIDSEVYKFWTNGTYTDEHFDTIIGIGNGNPYGITYYDGFFWITDQFDALVYKYWTNGTYTGTTLDVDTAAGNGNPYGITNYAGYLWVTDEDDDLIYQYWTNGTYTGVSFDTSTTGGDNPYGMVAYDGYFWIVDYNEEEVFKYDTGYLEYNFNIEGIDEGTHNWTLESYDTFGNLGTTETWEFTVSAADTTPPTITIHYPTNTIYNETLTELNFSAADETALSLCWYSIDSGATNSSPNDCSSNFTGLSSTEGSNTWTVYVNDTSGNENSSSVTFTQNSAPTIPFVQAIAAQDPTIGSITTIIFNFTAEDTDGESNLNDSTAEAFFTRSGESTRSDSSCTQIGAAVGDQKNYTCSIDMWYFDENGAWDINVTIKDKGGSRTENSTETFTYNLQTAMVISPTSLTWPEISLTGTDTGSSNDPITINNSGNDINLNINVTGYDLRGEETTTEYIYAHNFTVEATSEGCSGTTLSNATSLNITSAILQRGNNTYNYGNSTSGQEQIFFCLKGVPQDISSQSYSSSAYGAWEVRILLVAIIPRRRRKTKKQKEKDERLFGALDIIVEKLKEDLDVEDEEITEKVINRLVDKYKLSKKKIASLIGEEIKIPTSIFSKDLGALESLVKYMRENLKMKYKEIANELERDEKTIWTAYKKGKEKQKGELKIKRNGVNFPLSIFKKDNLTVLESIIIYLKKKEFNFSEIGELLERDQRNIWTIFKRVEKKLNDKK